MSKGRLLFPVPLDPVLPPLLQPHPVSLLGAKLGASLIEPLNLAKCTRLSLTSRPLRMLLSQHWIPLFLTPPIHLASIGKCLLPNKNNSSLHFLSTYSVLSASQMLSYFIVTTAYEVKMVIVDM